MLEIKLKLIDPNPPETKVFNQVNLDRPPPAQYLVHKSLAANRRHVAASYWTAASDVAPTSARSSSSVNDGQRRRSMTVNAAGHRLTAADHGGDRRSTVAVNDDRRWRTTVDCRWTTVDHHRTTGQRWLVGWSTLGTGPVWIGSGPGLDRVWTGSGSGPPRGMPRVSHVCTRVSHVCPRGIHVDADVDNVH
nr:hypothetical protein [Tanacetum cinerariifolium]